MLPCRSSSCCTAKAQITPNALTGMTPGEAGALEIAGQTLPPMAMVTVDGGDGYWNPHPEDNPMEMVVSELIPMCQRMNLGKTASEDRCDGYFHGWIWSSFDSREVSRP